jgi:hypothetical protein
VFVLIGDGTFSSAQDNAIAMHRELSATLIGEATGERPNGYGEVRQLKLPNSGLQIRYSTEYFRMLKDSDPDALYPDIAAPPTLEDVLAGRDAALDARRCPGRPAARNNAAILISCSFTKPTQEKQWQSK